MQKIVMRTAISQDLPAMENLEKLFPDPWSPKTLSHDLLKGPGYYIVATCDEAVVGFICLWFVADEVQIVRLAVAREFQRKGIASALLAKGIAEAKDRKATYMHLEVRESNIPAIAMYKKAGFTVRNKRPDAYEKPTENGYIMAMDFGEETTK